ncbi:MAG: hypothetical protein KAS67_00725, partial [Thermoplasmata archaeon]|nr:hypothetical protein [Thermoplasmata archaeon]
IMLTTLLAGVIVSSLVPIDISFKMFSLFTAIAFVIIIFGILEKMKSAGVKPGKSDLAVAGIVTIFILTLISIIMRSFRGQTPEDFNMMDYALEWFVIILAFLLTFLTVVMGCIMGAHISEGWYLLAAGAGIFAVSYILQTVLIAFGNYHGGHFIGVLDVAALFSVAFSAWYQRKKHLELISGI